ncbi:hypothetical protein [Methylobacterium sp.]|uniref:hypothetical protein n=1 Tax=Methylobacterium sp. TaxID=409 RepID=UPI003B01A740
MKSKIIPAFAGIAMLAVLPGYAVAGWMDNVPPRFLPQTHQSQRTTPPDVEAPDVGRTTGSIKAAPRSPAARQMVPPAQDF